MIKRLTLLTVLLWAGSSAAATLYLDGNLSGNCSGSYNVSSRNCGGGSDTAYASMGSALSALRGGDTLIIRPGRYSRMRLGGSHRGTSGRHTVVRTLAGEERQAIICANTDRCHSYPPNVSYTEFAIMTRSTSFIDIIGLKTYGMCVPAGGSETTDILFQDMDCGGGGPGKGSDGGDWRGTSTNQPAVLACHTGRRITIRNSKIHHSGTSADAPHNASCYMQYDCGDLLLENLEVYECEDDGLFIKDGGGRGDITLRNILTHDVGNDGFRGFNQDPISGHLRIENSVGDFRALSNAGDGTSAHRLNGNVSGGGVTVTEPWNADLSRVGVFWDAPPTDSEPPAAPSGLLVD